MQKKIGGLVDNALLQSNGVSIIWLFECHSNPDFAQD